MNILSSRWRHRPLGGPQPGNLVSQTPSLWGSRQGDVFWQTYVTPKSAAVSFLFQSSLSEPRSTMRASNPKPSAIHSQQTTCPSSHNKSKLTQRPAPHPAHINPQLQTHLHAAPVEKPFSAWFWLRALPLPASCFPRELTLSLTLSLL